MKDTLTYKGFMGSVHFSADDKVFHGKLVGVKDLVTFEGDAVDELIKTFYAAVEDYLELCKEVGKEPLKPLKGSFNVRITPELHGRALKVASVRGVTLNRLVQTALEHEVEGKHAYMKPLKKVTKSKKNKSPDMAKDK